MILTLCFTDQRSNGFIKAVLSVGQCNSVRCSDWCKLEVNVGVCVSGWLGVRMDGGVQSVTVSWGFFEKFGSDWTNPKFRLNPIPKPNHAPVISMHPNRAYLGV